MLSDFVEVFYQLEKLFTREGATWLVIDIILSIILVSINAGGIPVSYTKKTGEDKWTNFKFR